MCMNSHTVHLEVAKSMETDDFIMVLVRFLNRRGHVKEIRSDNGTNFVGADREIKEAIDCRGADGTRMQMGISSASSPTHVRCVGTACENCQEKH